VVYVQDFELIDKTQSSILISKFIESNIGHLVESSAVMLSKTIGVICDDIKEYESFLYI
jgi:hypothetical protein